MKLVILVPFIHRITNSAIPLLYVDKWSIYIDMNTIRLFIHNELDLLFGTVKLARGIGLKLF